MKPAACPCGGGLYEHCCAKFHQGTAAPDALALMRSRYSAYALGLFDYLRATWHHSTVPADLGDENGAALKWLGLQVKHHSAEGERATVEFVARYRVKGKGERLHEVSRFVCEAGRWFYVDGDLL